MKSEETRVTEKYQTTIPKQVRRYLKVKPKDTITWTVLRSMVVLDKQKKMSDPVGFLTSQVKRPLSFDAVRLVNETRQDLS